MLTIDHTCIKKGNYTVATEKPEPTPVNPEIDTPDPDFDHEPSEIDYPDYMGVDFEVIIAETRKDIVESKFLDKFAYYMDLLKVSRHELDSFLDYEFDFNNPENFEIKVLDTKVFERLFELYCPDTGFVIPAQHNHHLREYLERLEPDGRMIVRNQLNLFGEV